MKLPKIQFPELQPDPSSTQGRAIWNSVLVSTPVVLTILSTVLAGLSSSEMTLAQYYRGLAAQNQSKAGDQWSFFQAKRIRGSTLEIAVDLLRALSDRGTVEPAAVRSAAEQLKQALHGAEKDASRLVELLARSADEKQQPAAGRLVEVARAQAKQAEAAGERIMAELAHTDAQRVFSYLDGNDLPQVGTKTFEHPQIEEAVRAVQQRRAESDTAPIVAQISEESLRLAVQSAETNIQAVEAADNPVSDRLKELDKLLQEQVNRALAFHRAVREVNASVADLPAGDSGPSAEIRSTAAALAKRAAKVKAATEELNNDFKAAHHAYTARRYEREARYNQQAVALYEVQVRKSSISSERHRARSKHFFYGMLAAQAGVMIASFSLAVKHKSIMWGLASLAGLGAILFGLYVYVYM